MVFYADAARWQAPVGSIAGKVEPSLKDCPLNSGGVAGPLCQLNANGWRSLLHDERRRSFVSCKQRAFPQSKLREWWRRCEDELYWNQPEVGGHRLNRSAAWLTKGGCECAYRYSGTEWPRQRMQQWFLEMTEHVCQVCGITERPNSCNANLYVDGGQSVGWHADDEPYFDATKNDTLIISLSLGAPRTFMLKSNQSPLQSAKMQLGDGDLCTMEGRVQKHYKHCVPPEKRAQGARINLTWRWVLVHEGHCPLGGANATSGPARPLGTPDVKLVKLLSFSEVMKKKKQLDTPRLPLARREAPPGARGDKVKIPIGKPRPPLVIKRSPAKEPPKSPRAPLLAKPEAPKPASVITARFRRLAGFRQQNGHPKVPLSPAEVPWISLATTSGGAAAVGKYDVGRRPREKQPALGKRALSGGPTPGTLSSKRRKSPLGAPLARERQVMPDRGKRDARPQRTGLAPLKSPIGGSRPASKTDRREALDAPIGSGDVGRGPSRSEASAGGPIGSGERRDTENQSRPRKALLVARRAA